MTKRAIPFPRNKCVLTGREDLKEVYTFKDFPIYVGCVDPSTSKDDDVFCDMKWGYSSSSGSLQLLELLDPNLLYREHHNPGTVGKIWSRHHKVFHDFIHSNGYKNVLEIGGASGSLLKHFLPYTSDFTWTIIEPSDQKFTDDPRVHFIPEFFETYELKEKYDTLVHSHLFEHVYNPIEFLEKANTILEDGGYHYITLPNMRHWLESGFTNTLLFEHTFYVDDMILEYLLNKTGFEIVEKIVEPHSIFICCKKTSGIEVVDPVFDYPLKLYNDYINTLKTDLDSILSKIEDSKVYLFGGHIFSQILLNMGLPEEQVVCVLDNDPGKQGKRLYGSNLIVESPECLKGLNSPVVILRGGSYTEEITESLLKVNSTVRIV